MEKEIIEMLCKDCRWYEKIIIKSLKRIFIESYNKIITNIIKNYKIDL